MQLKIAEAAAAQEELMKTKRETEAAEALLVVAKNKLELVGNNDKALEESKHEKKTLTLT
mgnify:CR=1 FL=1